jgi:hypothetical protein
MDYGAKFGLADNPKSGEGNIERELWEQVLENLLLKQSRVEGCT